MSPRIHFKQALRDLRYDMLYMGEEIQKLVNMTLEVVINNNMEVAEEVLKSDDEIDELEIAIQRQCVLLIAREQPLAKDLRLIMSIIKIVTDMERIADQCIDVCTYCIKVHDKQYTVSDAFKRHVNKMAQGVSQMLDKLIQSYKNKDLDSIQEVRDDDDKIDARFTQIWQEIIDEMSQNPEFIPNGPDYIMIIKYLERIADHVTNIAEWMMYNITGEYTL